MADFDENGAHKYYGLRMSDLPLEVRKNLSVLLDNMNSSVHYEYVAEFFGLSTNEIKQIPFLHIPESGGSNTMKLFGKVQLDEHMLSDFYDFLYNKGRKDLTRILDENFRDIRRFVERNQQQGKLQKFKERGSLGECQCRTCPMNSMDFAPHQPSFTEHSIATLHDQRAPMPPSYEETEVSGNCRQRTFPKTSSTDLYCSDRTEVKTPLQSSCIVSQRAPVECSEYASMKTSDRLYRKAPSINEDTTRPIKLVERQTSNSYQNSRANRMSTGSSISSHSNSSRDSGNNNSNPRRECDISSDGPQSTSNGLSQGQISSSLDSQRINQPSLNLTINDRKSDGNVTDSTAPVQPSSHFHMSLPSPNDERPSDANRNADGMIPRQFPVERREINDNQNVGTRGPVFITWDIGQGGNSKIPLANLWKFLKSNKFIAHFDQYKSTPAFRGDANIRESRTRFERAKFIIVLITPSYKSASEGKQPTTFRRDNEVHRTNADRIYTWLQNEFLNENNAPRVIPVLADGADIKRHVPHKINIACRDERFFKFPQQAMDLIHYLKDKDRNMDPPNVFHGSQSLPINDCHGQRMDYNNGNIYHSH